MAIAFVQKTAKFLAGPATSVTSGDITTTTGNFVVMTLSAWNGAGPPTLSDSKSNTWAVDATLGEVDFSNNYAAIGSAQLVSAGASHNFTATDTAGMYLAGNVSEFSGIATSSAVDVTDTSNSNGTTVTCTTATTTQADELVIGCVSVVEHGPGSNPQGITDPPTGYTSIGVEQNTQAYTGYEAAYKIVSATGTQTATWSWTPAANVTGPAALVTYKASSSAAPVLIAPPFAGMIG